VEVAIISLRFTFLKNVVVLDLQGCGGHEREF